MRNPVIAVHAVSALVIREIAEAGDQFVSFAFAEELQREIDELKKELSLAIEEVCNDYWNKGHAQRVFKRWGIGHE